MALGSYKNSPFVTGGYPNGLETEILEYERSAWVQGDNYPFSNHDRFVFIRIVELI